MDSMEVPKEEVVDWAVVVAVEVLVGQMGVLVGDLVPWAVLVPVWKVEVVEDLVAV